MSTSLHRSESGLRLLQAVAPPSNSMELRSQGPLRGSHSPPSPMWRRTWGCYSSVLDRCLMWSWRPERKFQRPSISSQSCIKDFSILLEQFIPLLHLSNECYKNLLDTVVIYHCYTCWIGYNIIKEFQNEAWCFWITQGVVDWTQMCAYYLYNPKIIAANIISSDPILWIWHHLPDPQTPTSRYTKWIFSKCPPNPKSSPSYSG